MKTKKQVLLITAGVIVMSLVVFVAVGPRKPHLSVPSPSIVKSMQARPQFFSNSSPRPNIYVKPISNNTPKNKATISKVLLMLSNAKPVTYDPSLTVVGPDVIFTLDNKQQLDIAIPWLPAKDKQPDGRVVDLSKRSTEYVDVQIVSYNSAHQKWMRYESPALNNWIESGWKRDLSWTTDN